MMLSTNRTNTQNNQERQNGGNNDYTLNIYGLNDQAIGAFDGGRIKETKPIGFPREGSTVRRVGPLFYWAWAYSDQPAVIGMHPHQGFEIISYVLRGQMGHKDSGGNERMLDEGGLQVMQTASGISHEEQMIGDEGTDFFQIWFEPDLNKTVNDPAVYKDYALEEIPYKEIGPAKVHQMIGSSGAFDLETDAVMNKVILPKGESIDLVVAKGRSLALVVMKGVAAFSNNQTAERKAFVVIEAFDDSVLNISASENEELEFMAIDVPQKVGYNLYEKG